MGIGRFEDKRNTGWRAPRTAPRLWGRRGDLVYAGRRHLTSCRTAKCAGSARNTVRRRTPVPHKDRSPRQETCVEGLSFWEGERYQHTRRGSLDSLGFQLDQQKRGLTRMKVSEDAPFRCGSPISLQNDSCLSAMSVIASASKHTVSCTHALNNLNVSDKCVAASGIPAIASAPFAGKRPQEKRSCLEG